jgi:hypothetical protein
MTPEENKVLRKKNWLLLAILVVFAISLTAATFLFLLNKKT